jgi:phosphatidylglycerophosphatase A
MGTLVAIPIAWLLALGGQWVFLGGLAVVTLVGTWASDVFVKKSGLDDDQRIVVDEVAGYLVTLAPVVRGPVQLALGFFLFRLFDITKPPPVRQIDRAVGGGFGVMADDLAAGVYAGGILWLLEHYGIIAKIAYTLGLGS